MTGRTHRMHDCRRGDLPCQGCHEAREVKEGLALHGPLMTDGEHIGTAAEVRDQGQWRGEVLQIDGLRPNLQGVVTAVFIRQLQ